MMTGLHHVLIVVAILLYLWHDGFKLLLDTISFLAFTIMVVYVFAVAVPCILYLAGMVVAGPVIRTVFRIDTSSWAKYVLAWLMTPIRAGLFSKLTELGE